MSHIRSNPKYVLASTVFLLLATGIGSAVATWHAARPDGGGWLVGMWVGLIAELGVVGAVAALGWRLASEFAVSGEILERFAEGDLSPRAPIVARGSFASIARSVNSVGEAQCALVTELREASHALDRESDSFQAAFSRIKSQSQRSREASGTVAAALEEMTVGVASITKEVLEVNDVVLEACGSSRRLNGMAFDASVSVSRQYLSLQTTSDAMGKAKESMVELEKSGAEIAGMAEGIMDVAKRTRLLALNASIEAARAGEKGRGFAVVAQEVKELAHQAAGMAERIQGQVEAVSRGTEKVAQELSETELSLRSTMKDAFLALVSVEHQCAVSYESSMGLETTSRNMSEIARTIEESKAALDEINQSTHELDTRARSVDAAIEGAQPGVDEIGRFARSFQGTVKEMKVRPPFFPWADDLSVGVGRMDDQHKVLLRLINRVADLTESGGGGASIRIVVGQLVDYTKFHFQDEEKLMAATAFPDLAAHRKVHEGFVAEVGRMVAKATEGDSIDAASLLPVLKDWLVRHINGTDKVYGAHVVASRTRDGGAV